MKKYFASSELIINEDGSAFHLHVKPEWLADKVILVGDPGRVALVASHFENKECEVESREFKTITGTYKGKRITVVSTGIGCDNIDIVMNELDALANIDFQTREEKPQLRQLELVRIGTCGGMQTEVKSGDVIVATGGFSYQTTGSTGDGYRFAKEAGHTVTEIRPSLVPFNAKEDYVREMQGLSLKNVNVRIYRGKKVLYDEFGEMLFTHFGVSGPLILTASAMIRSDIAKEPLAMEIDLKPALTEEQLDKRVLKDFEEAKNKQFKNSIGKLFPAKMIPVMIGLSGIDRDKKVNEITKEERLKFVRLIKAFPLTLNGLRDFNEAIITKGGVRVSEVNPSTMESKLVRHLYFCGEVLDLDALTGGFNLQIAWSTGHLAGMCVE